MGIKYLDLYDNEQELTEEEVNWFTSIVNAFQQVMMEYLGYIIPITCKDHYREMKGKSKEAAGIYYTNKKGGPAFDDFITIDTSFVHDCFCEIYNAEWNMWFETVDHCIAHEIAHALVFRHGKKHSLLTEQIFDRYKAINNI